jgi:ankyrin repeat protein
MNLFKGLFSTNKSEKDFGIELFRALYEPNKNKVVDLIESRKIDINKYLEGSNSILINAVNCSNDFHDSDEQIGIVNYLLDNKADVNWKNENGYTALQIALEFHSLSKTSLLLIRKGNPNVHITDKKHGNSPIFTAIREYGATWKEEQKEVNQLRFEIIEELLSRGAELDKLNNHGMTARKWLERISENDRVHQLIAKFDKK